MRELVVGMKVYSYCFGEMTVKSNDGEYIVANIEHPELMAPALAAKYGKVVTSVKYQVNAFGHWYFDNAKDALDGIENNDFAEAAKQSQIPLALQRDPAFLNLFFTQRKQPSGVTVKNNPSSGITVSGGDGSGGPSPVQVIVS